MSFANTGPVGQMEKLILLLFIFFLANQTDVLTPPTGVWKETGAATQICVATFFKAVSYLSVLETWRRPNTPAEERCRSD